ncbi:MAG: glycosyltransferase family 4 protein [Rubrivivax sp.]|nr:glycosyltransferase family 4 protein [Rubrivivax sp.]
MTRLLNINTYHYRRGGSDVVYLDHAAMMQREGFDCGYFAMQHPKNEPTPWSEHFVDEIEFGHDYGLAQKLVMAGKVVWSWEARKKLARLLDQFPADIAHLHCIYHHLSPAILPLLAARGVPAVLTAHDLKIACPAYKMLTHDGICERCKDGSVINVVRHRCVRGSLAASAIVAVESGLHRSLNTWQRHLAAVVCPSRFFLEKFVAWGWRREQLLHIPNWVDASTFEPRFEPGRHVLYFGRLAPEKGVATLIRAAHQARVALRIVGTGPEESTLRALVTEMGNTAEFVGYRSGQALHDEIRAARAVVLPSEWYENAPMSVLESMALGTVVIGADIGGIGEIVEHGKTGWLFASGDVSALAERLAATAALPDTALVTLARAGRLRVEQVFSRERYMDAMLALYARLGAGAPQVTRPHAAVQQLGVAA